MIQTFVCRGCPDPCTLCVETATGTPLLDAPPRRCPIEGVADWHWEIPAKDKTKDQAVLFL